MKKIFTLFAAVLMAGSMMAESELLYTMTTESVQGSNNAYASNCDIEMDGVTWNFTGNSQMNPWRIGGKSLAAVDREVYTKTAYAAALDSVCLYLGNNTLTSLDGVKLVYSTKADFSDAEEVIAAVPEAFPATVTFAAEGGFPAKAYYKFVLTCTVSGSSNKYIQFNGVDFWGEKPAAPAVATPVLSVAAGDYYDAQKVAITCETEGATIYYQTTGDWADAIAYTDSIVVAETTTIYAKATKGADMSEEVSKTYTIAPVYESFDELVNEAGAPAGQKVVVNFEGVVVDSLYTTKTGKVNGVYLTAAGRMVEIYCYDVPAEWEVGGTISGTVKGEWKNYNGTWEVCPASWQGIEYTPATAIEDVNANANVIKVIENGQVVIIRDDKKFTVAGAEL